MVVGSLVVAGVVSVLVIQNSADGPVGPIPGGGFTSGMTVEGDVNMVEVVDFNDQVEIQQ